MISEISMSTLLGFEKLGIHVVNGGEGPTLEQRTSAGTRQIKIGDANDLLDCLQQLPRKAITNGFDSQAFMGLIHAMSDLGYRRNGTGYLDKLGQPMSDEQTLQNLEKYLLCDTLLGYAKRNLGDPTNPVPKNKGYTSVNAIESIKAAVEHAKTIGRDIHLEMRQYYPEIVADCLKLAEQALKEHNLSRQGTHNQGEPIIYQDAKSAYRYLEHASGFSEHMPIAQQSHVRTRLNLLYQRTKEAANAIALRHERMGIGYEEIAASYRKLSASCEGKVKA